MNTPAIGVRRARLLILAPLALLLLGDTAPDAARRELERTSPEVGHSDAAIVRQVVAQTNPDLDSRTLSRIAAAVVRYSEELDLDPALVTAVIRVESSARPWVRSPKGAIGLMQVMPHMMLPMGLAGNPTTIEANIQAGCSILADNIRRLGEQKGISAYFWGSNIRGVAYFEKVQAARDELRRLRPS